MKKFVSAMLAGAVALSLAACGGSAASSTAVSSTASSAAASSTAAEPAAEPAAETVVPGVLTVATSPDFAPYEFYSIDASGTAQLAGFDIAMAQAIADELGLTLSVIPMDFDSILMELQSGNVDLGISGFSPSPERAQTFDFSDIYYMGGQSFVVLDANADKYTDYSDFAGLSVGAQTGSIQYGLAEENTPDANIVGLSKVTDLITELLNGKLDGAFIETDVAKAYEVNYPELNLLWDVEYEAKGSAIALRKGNDGMRTAVNGVIATLLADGRMEQYILEAQELSADEENVYEGLLDENGEVAAESEAASSQG